MPTDSTMRIVPGSSGSFLCPPGHPMLSWHLEAGHRRNPTMIAGLDYALSNEYLDVPDAIRNQVVAMYDAAKLVRSPLWEAHAYGYFKRCYSPDGVDRNASRCLIVGQPETYTRDTAPAGHVWSQYDSLNRGPIVRADDPRCTPEHHLAYLTVRKYFPDATPNERLLKAERAGIAGFGAYGAHPCDNCGVAVQYEAACDGWATQNLSAAIGDRAACWPVDGAARTHTVHNITDEIT